MRSYLIAAFLIILATGSSGAVEVSDRGTPEQAKALVEKAAAFLKDVGPEKAFPEFNNSNGPFIDHDLYIFVEDMTATTQAHGTNRALIGKSLYDLKDADGKLFAREFVSVAQTKGAGWVSYKWPNPTSKKIEEKTTYVMKVGDLIVGCGAYKP